MSEIVPLAPRHSRAVAALHMRNLSTPYCGEPGRRLLGGYYRTVALGRGAAGYVAEDHDRVLGYVCGVWAPAELQAVLFKTQWPRLALWGPASLLLRPQLLISFMRRLGRSAGENVDQPVEGYELRPIVVDPAARGSGLAPRLVERLVLDALSRGFDRMHLFTEIDNQAAQGLYRKMGFMTTGTVQHNSRSMFRYERLLGGTA